MPEILQTAVLPVADQPEEILEVQIPVLDGMDDTAQWLRMHGDGVKCLITHAMRGASRELMDNLPNLELIANFGAGTDLIDIAYAKEKGIAVTASGDVLSDDVADLTLWMILTLLRGNVGADAYVRQGKWSEKPLPLGRGAKGRKLGILGYGRIGQAIALRARAFGMEIGYHSRRQCADSREIYHASPLYLAQWSDILVVALPAGNETDRIIGEAMINAIGPQGLLVNIARGSLVDERALISALADERLGGAGLDVYDSEPHIDTALFKAPRLILSPHIGSATSDCRNAMRDYVVDNIWQWRNGKALKGRI